jgi:hypothetical protein
MTGIPMRRPRGPMKAENSNQRLEKSARAISRTIGARNCRGWQATVAFAILPRRESAKNLHRRCNNSPKGEDSRVGDFAPQGQPQTSPGQSGAAIAAERRPGVGNRDAQKP